MSPRLQVSSETLMRSLLHGIASVDFRVSSLNVFRTSRTILPIASRNFIYTDTQWQSATTQVQLRPYQEESISSVLDHLGQGKRRLGISLATGAGKTVIFSHLIDRVAPATENATQTLIMAHRRELVEQAARHCRNLYPDKSIDIEMGASHASGLADITVASVQSITSGDRLMRYNPARFKLVLVDEAHHIVAQTYLAVLGHFGLASKEVAEKGATALVGVSATLSRADGLALGSAIDYIVYHKDYVEMIEDRWLSDARFTTVESGANLSQVKHAKGDYQIGPLSRAVNTPEVNEVTVRSWLQIAKDRKSTLAFCVDLAHVAALANVFRKHGYDARSVTSNTPLKVRAETLAAFKAGAFPVLINCGIFTEGTDIPNIDCIILARPTKSRNLLIQMMGRGLRTSPGKEDCHIIDMVASLAKGIVTTPTLFGLDPNEVVKNVTAEGLKDLKDRKDQELMAVNAAKYELEDPANVVNLPGNITFTHFDDVNSLIESTSGERHIRGISRLAWVQVDDQSYILSDKSGSFLSLKSEKSTWSVTCTRKLRAPPSEKAKSPFMRPVTIASNSTFEHAINAADTFAKRQFARPMVLASAPWRGMPATPEQLSFLNRFRKEDQQLQPGSTTKGSAADRITKLKHGARGRISRAQTTRAKSDKERRRVDNVRSASTQSGIFARLSALYKR